MKMASRNIASMHLFLEMKKKFPDLPEDTLRNYVQLYAQDQDKCVSLLQEESKNHHFHSSQLFSDIRLSESKIQSKKNEDVDLNFNQGSKSSNISAVFWQNSSNKEPAGTDPFTVPPLTSKKSSHSSGIRLPIKSSDLKVPLKPEIQSAPVTSSYDRPFTDMFKNIPISSHNALCHTPSDRNADSRMMFSTTKEHQILPVESSRTKDTSSSLPDSCTIEPSKRHAVRLSITPSFPFSQQQMNVYGSSVCASTSHSSKPGRHTTSLNLQLQPQSSDAYPVEISTIPTNIGSDCNYRDFGSHVQISVGSQGATFTALRLQRPQHAPQSQPSSNKLPVAEQASFKVSQSSSQTQNSKVFQFPTHLQQTSARRNHSIFSEKNNYAFENNLSKVIPDEDHINIEHGHFHLGNKTPSKNLNAETNFLHGYQASPDYILAVKKHQVARLELVEEELNKEKAICSKLKFEVNKLEQELLRRREKKNSFSSAELLKKMKEENRRLTLECNDLVMEYDLCSKDQIPVGVTDEDFYSNIFTGPNDGLNLHSDDEKSKKVPYHKDKFKTSSADDEDEENTWKCKNCTFANHPALQKCEMCELPKNSGSFFSDS